MIAGLFLVPDLSMAAYFPVQGPAQLSTIFFTQQLGRCFWRFTACCLANYLRRFLPVSGLPISALTAPLATA